MLDGPTELEVTQPSVHPMFEEMRIVTVFPAAICTTVGLMSAVSAHPCGPEERCMLIAPKRENEYQRRANGSCMR